MGMLYSELKYGADRRRAVEKGYSRTSAAPLIPGYGRVSYETSN